MSLDEFKDIPHNPFSPFADAHRFKIDDQGEIRFNTGNETWTDVVLNDLKLDDFLHMTLTPTKPIYIFKTSPRRRKRDTSQPKTRTVRSKSLQVARDAKEWFFNNRGDGFGGLIIEDLIIRGYGADRIFYTWGEESTTLIFEVVTNKGQVEHIAWRLDEYGDWFCDEELDSERRLSRCNLFKRFRIPTDSDWIEWNVFQEKYDDIPYKEEKEVRECKLGKDLIMFLSENIEDLVFSLMFRSGDGG